VAVDGAGNLFLADQSYDQGADEYRYSIRKVSPDGLISTLALIPVCCYGDMTADGAGNLFVVAGSTILRIAPNGDRTVVAGNGNYGLPSGDGQPAIQAQLNGPTAVTLNAAGDLLIADNTGRNVRKVTADGIIRAVASIPGLEPVESGDDGPATAVQLQLAFAGIVAQSGLAVDRAGNLYIAETAGHRIRRVSPSGTITTVAGTGERCSGPSDCPPLGDGGPARRAFLYFPTSVAIDSAGNLFIADSGNFRVRKVSPDGIITTVAGNGSAPPWPRATADGASATDVPILPSHVMVDGDDRLYIAEDSYPDVRKVSTDGTIHTAIPSFSRSGYSGNISASTVDRVGNLFVAGFMCDLNDTCSLTIRRFSATGAITTIATGNPVSLQPGSDIGDGKPASTAQLGFVSALAVDLEGNLFLSDLFSQRVRKIDLAGIITTIGGNGTPGYSGDGGPAADASLDHPIALAVDAAGNVYVSDFNQSVRVLRPVAQ
jgi:hypothetical protein